STTVSHTTGLRSLTNKFVYHDFLENSMGSGSFKSPIPITARFLGATELYLPAHVPMHLIRTLLSSPAITSRPRLTTLRGVRALLERSERNGECLQSWAIMITGPTPR